MTKIKKYNEYVDYEDILHSSTITDIEIERCSLVPLSSDTTGLENIVIWIGENPYNDTIRVKVSNHSNSRSIDDVFTITLPDMSILGNINKKFIDDNKLNDIKKFLTINKDIISKYSTSDTMSTPDLTNNLISFNNL